MESRLLQVWRDYYDELFEVDLMKGTYRSLMETTRLGAKTSFVNIEVILFSEKRIHPDDKSAFALFFDKDKILENIKNDIYVTKMNFRMKTEDGGYRWVKVKNIVPRMKGSEDITYFSCFRTVDKETGEDMRYKQELNDALSRAEELNARKSRLIENLLTQVRTPLNGIIGMTDIAKKTVGDAGKTYERLDKISEAARKMNESLNLLLKEEGQYIPSIEPEQEEASDMQYIYVSAKGSEGAAGFKAEEKNLPSDFVFFADGVNTQTAAKELSDTDFSGKRILVVEDNQLNSEVLKEIFEATGAQVDIVEDGKQAVIRFVANPAGYYDLLLVDLELPILDGYGVARCIRISGKDDSRDVPIIAVTSKNLPEDIRRAYNNGFDAYFPKPVNFEMLKSKVAEVLKKGQ